MPTQKEFDEYAAMTPEEKKLCDYGDSWRVSRNAERRDAELTYKYIRLAVAAGTSEVRASKIAGVDRMTVRRALGKL
jgi:hypothetical protein